MPSIVKETARFSEAYRRKAKRDVLLSPAISNEMLKTVNGFNDLLKELQHGPGRPIGHKRLSTWSADLYSRLERDLEWHDPSNHIDRDKRYLKQLGWVIKGLWSDENTAGA